MSAQMAETSVIAAGVTPAEARGRSTRAGGRAVWVATGMLVTLILACFLLPSLLGLPGPSAGTLKDARLAPGTSGHLLGTDALGDDVLVRALHGGRVSFVVATGSAVVGLLIGGLVGIVSGYRRGFVDTVVTRALDVLLAFPPLVLALVVAAYLGPSLRNAVLAVAFFQIPAFARVARSKALEVRGEDYIAAARLAGVREVTIMVRHVVPNVGSTMLTFFLLQVGVAMIIESALSYLGLGVQPPAPSWGNMMASGQPYISAAPWIILVPGAFLFMAIFTINLLADSLRQKRDAR